MSHGATTACTEALEAVRLEVESGTERIADLLRRYIADLERAEKVWRR